MNRREILKYTGLAFGYAATAGTMSALLSGCKVEPKLNFVPQYLSQEAITDLTSMVDIIFPKTQSPSASEVGVPEFIDSVLANVADEKEKSEFKTAQKAFNDYVLQKTGGKYSDMSDADKTKFIMQLDTATYAEEENELPKAVAEFWQKVKGNTFFGWFSSEEVGKNITAYLPVPGPYKGCVDISESAGKAWTLGGMLS